MIQLPPSKSIGARFMVASYFAGSLPGEPIFDENDDLMVLQDALLEVYSDEEPIDYGDSPLDVGASGTALRFITAVCASSPGADYVITGTPRLMQRPMQPLIDLLKEAGAGINPLGPDASGPYRVIGKKLNGGNFSIRGDISSQFISALMLVSPYWEKGMKLSFSTPLVSKPYIEMTAKLMQKFHVKVKLSDSGVEVPHTTYIIPPNYRVEADWSSASFFYEACALGAEDIELEGLSSPRNSLQGDAVTAELFAKLGVISKFNNKGVILEKNNEEKPEKLEIDFKDCPDLVLPFAVASLLLDVKFRFFNVAHLRLKESDRLESLRAEALKLGYQLEVRENEIEWNGQRSEKIENPVIQTYDDHRVAMSFAIAAIVIGEIRIQNPEVVEKSFINFWNMLPQIDLSCRQEGDVMIVSK